MILEIGSKILVAHRRLFPEDQARFFIGTVNAYEHGIARVTGHSWVLEQVRGDILRKPDLRTKFFSLASGTLIIYLLPANLDLEKLKILHKKNQETVLTDGASFTMDISDRHH